MQDFFHMGGYAIYVWPSFASFLLMLLGSWGTAVRRDRRIRQDIQRQSQNKTQ